MYNFIDVNEVSEVATLPSEALQINGEFIENLIPGYRTLQVSGREALSPELTTYETGVRDGSALQSKRYPARIIIVTYQLIAKSNEAFREAYNKLASVLDVEEAELIFNDEPDKFFKGTLQSIGEVPPGMNAVVGEFEFFCADPFKYSVVEYEANPAIDNSFLIDYNGTHKAYPTLEAEFYNENEGTAGLTGNGDCGYVAFFNENEKIIQLGSPEETDSETYDRSQTLVNQQFQNETAWNTTAQTNWAMNCGNTTAMDCPQTGSVSMQPASYAITNAPTTSGTLLNAQSVAAKPYITYKVTAQATGREEDRTNVKVTILASVAGTASSTTPISTGAKITLNKTKIYVSSDASSSAGTKTGTFYLWDASIIRNRIRITNSAANVGKSGQVVGWVNVADVNLSTSNAAIGSGYGLKASIQFGGGDWKSVILKNESAVWKGNSSHTATLTVEVKNLDSDTIILEDIKFKVERTDNEDSKVGILEETDCNKLEISTYTAPVVDGWYLRPETFGTGAGTWHGPSITRTIPADAAGNVGASNFTFSWKQKLSIGNNSTAQSEMGMYQMLIMFGKGSERKVLAGISIVKNSPGKTGLINFYVNAKTVHTLYGVDLSYNNPFWGNDDLSKGISTTKTCVIRKSGSRFEFNIGGICCLFFDASAKDVQASEITFWFSHHGQGMPLSYSGIYWAKFVKDNCDTFANIPNKFSSNDIVTADCKSGEILLNNSPMPALGAMGNDWEDFYLTPGLNQIGFAYSDWVSADYAPKFKIRYREVFI